MRYTMCGGGITCILYGQNFGFFLKIYLYRISVFFGFARHNGRNYFLRIWVEGLVVGRRHSFLLHAVVGLYAFLMPHQRFFKQVTET